MMKDKIHRERIMKNKVTKYQKQTLPAADPKKKKERKKTLLFYFLDLELKSLTDPAQRRDLNHPEVSSQS